jgi:peptidyl-tRNA hydrolase
LIFLNSISSQKCSKKISLNCRANFSKLDCLETSRNLTRASWPELKETGWALTRGRLSCAVVHHRLISGEVMASSNLKERATAVREDVSVGTKKSMWKRNDKEEILETERERERERNDGFWREIQANAKERNDNEWWFLDCLLIFYYLFYLIFIFL